MRGPAPLLPLLAALALLAGCGNGEAEEPPLAIDAVGEAEAKRLVAEAVSAGLTAFDPTGQVVPGLAQSWRVSDDGLSIVFRLRAATFADGRPLTAADVVASIDRARNGRAGAMARDLLAGVSGVSAPLDNVVELRLLTPQPELLQLLATPPLAIQSRRNRQTAGAYVVVNAPAAEQAPGETRLALNEAFHAAEAVRVPAAIIRTTEVEAAIRRFNREETDLVLGGGLDGLGSARVTARRESLLPEQPRAALLLLVNLRRQPLADQRVRRALSLAVDRARLGLEFFGSDSALGVEGLSPRTIAGYAVPEPDWAALPFVARQEESRRLLSEAGFDGSTRSLTLNVAVSNSPAEARLMELVARDLAGVGVRLTLSRRDAEGQRRAIEQGSFDLALLRRDTPVDSPLPFLLPFLCDRNRHGVCLPEADRLLADSWKAPSRAARLAALAAAERLWAEDGAAIGLVQPLGWSLVSPRVSGFAPNPSGSHALSHLSVDQPRKLLK